MGRKNKLIVKLAERNLKQEKAIADWRQSTVDYAGSHDEQVGMIKTLTDERDEARHQLRATQGNTRLLEKLRENRVVQDKRIAELEAEVIAATAMIKEAREERDALETKDIQLEDRDAQLANCQADLSDLRQQLELEAQRAPYMSGSKKEAPLECICERIPRDEPDENGRIREVPSGMLLRNPQCARHAWETASHIPEWTMEPAEPAPVCICDETVLKNDFTGEIIQAYREDNPDCTVHTLPKKENEE